MKVWRGEGRFLDLLCADPVVAPRLGRADLEDLFDLDYHVKHVDDVFARVLGAAP
jgi:adenylosuccinate lyase